MKKTPKWISQTCWAINGPNISMPGYTDMRPPDNIMAEISIGRMLMVASNQEKACEAETMWYVSTASLTAPLDKDWYEIYMWLFNRVMKDKVPDDLKFEKDLNDMQKRDLNRLQEWLFKKSYEATKAKLKAQDQERYERANPNLLNYFEDTT